MSKIQKALNNVGFIFEFNNFLSSEESSFIQSLSTSQKFQRSTTANKPPNNSQENTEYTTIYNEGRTSEVSFSNNWDNLLLQKIQGVAGRVSSLLEVGLDRLEPFQLVRYSEGQKFDPHLDCGLWGANERLYTVIVYLNDVTVGGTEFTNLKKTIQPTSGKLVVWQNTSESGECLEDMRHTGLSVGERETKYILVTWVRVHSFVGVGSKVKTNLEMLNEKFLLEGNYTNYKNFSSDEFKQVLSSMYSVCTCRVEELDFKKPTKTSKLKYSFKSDNQLLSIHVVVLSGSCQLSFKTGQTADLKEGSFLSIYNMNDTESFDSQFSFLNLDSLVVRIFGIHLNKL